MKIVPVPVGSNRFNRLNLYTCKFVMEDDFPMLRVCKMLTNVL